MRRRRFGIISKSIILAVVFILMSAVAAGAQSDDGSSYQILDVEENPNRPGDYKVLAKPDTASDAAAKWEPITVPTWARDDATLRERYMTAVIDYRRRGDVEAPGWLILDGRLIPGPYNIEVYDSFIAVNGLRVYPKKPPEIDTTRPISPEVMERIRVSDSLWTAVPVWLADGGMEEAERRAVEYMQGQPIIDTAYIEEPGRMFVVYHGRSRGVYFALGSVLDNHESPAGWPRELMEHEAGYLQVALNHQGLAISHDGQLAYRRFPDGPLVFARLQEICTTIPDIESRFELIREMIKNDKMARGLAERFMQ